jgi:hypothetical protein
VRSTPGFRASCFDASDARFSRRSWPGRMCIAPSTFEPRTRHQPEPTLLDRSDYSAASHALVLLKPGFQLGAARPAVARC